jgi:hypothetical protein
MTKNLLPLDEFRTEMGFNPYHFWQQANENVPVGSGCNSLISEYTWQRNDATGRNEIRQAIENAESRLRDYLGWSPLPHYVVKTIQFPRYPDPRFDKIGYAGIDARWMSMNLEEGKIIAMGSQHFDVIDADVAVVFSDANGDGVNDHFTLTTPTTVTDPDEIALYFSLADRADAVVTNDDWRIMPVKIVISGGNVTISGPSWLLVQPVKYQGVESNPIDPQLPGNFVTTLDIYRRWITSGSGALADAQCVFIWESRPYPWWANSYPVTSTDPAAVAMAVGRVGIRDAERGIVDLAEAYYDAATGNWNSYWPFMSQWRPPDRVEFRYLAGYKLFNQNVTPEMRALVSRMAAAELSRPICACDAANRELYRWQFDVSRAAGANDEQYAVSAADLGNPLGTCRGHVYAWKYISQKRLLKGVAF